MGVCVLVLWEFSTYYEDQVRPFQRRSTLALEGPEGPCVYHQDASPSPLIKKKISGPGVVLTVKTNKLKRNCQGVRSGYINQESGDFSRGVIILGFSLRDKPIEKSRMGFLLSPMRHLYMVAHGVGLESLVIDPEHPTPIIECQAAKALKSMGEFRKLLLSKNTLWIHKEYTRSLGKGIYVFS